MRAWQWRRGRGLSGTGGSRRAHRGQPPYLAQDEVGFAEDGPFRYQMRSSGVTQESGDRADVFLSQLPMSHKKADHWHRNWDAAGPILESRIRSAFSGGMRVTAFWVGALMLKLTPLSPLLKVVRCAVRTRCVVPQWCKERDESPRIPQRRAEGRAGAQSLDFGRFRPSERHARSRENARCVI